MKLSWSETATRDLLSIRRYIAKDNPSAAKSWITRLRARAENAGHVSILTVFEAHRLFHTSNAILSKK